MSVFETVLALARRVNGVRQTSPGEWRADGSPFELARIGDVTGRAYLFITFDDDVLGDGWETHPAVHEFQLYPEDSSPTYCLSPWVLDDGALEAVLAAEVDPDYARAAHRAGVTDAWQLIEAWRNGIPVEFLSAMGGAA